MNPEQFEDWWFNQLGEEESIEKYADKLTEEEIKRQHSFPCRENAITEACWERAYKAKVKP